MNQSDDCALAARLDAAGPTIEWRGAPRQIPILHEGAIGWESWLLCGGGAVDLNRLDPVAQSRVLKDHPEISAIHWSARGTCHDQVHCLEVIQHVQLRAPLRAIARVHHEWVLSPRFGSGFYLHDRALIEFSRPADGRDAAFFDRRDDPTKRDGWVLAGWQGHLLFYDPDHELVSGLVLPPQLEPVRLQVGLRQPDPDAAPTSGPSLPPLIITLSCTNPAMESDRQEWRSWWIAYRPRDTRFWWLEGLIQAMRMRGQSEHLRQLHPILAMSRLGVQRGDGAILYSLDLLANDEDAQPTLEPAVASDSAGRAAPPVAVHRNGPVCRYEIETRELPSGVYLVQLRGRHTCFVLEPDQGGGDVLHVLPTSQWRAYSANGNYYGVRRWPYTDSFGATVLQSPAPGYKRFFPPEQVPPPDYLPPHWDRSDLGVLMACAQAQRRLRCTIHYCTQEAIHFGRVRLGDYRLVLYGSHSEYVTASELRRLQRYVEQGGGLITLGGDNFGRLVAFVPDTPDFRYQRFLPQDGWYTGGFREAWKMRSGYVLPYSCSPSYQQPGQVRIIDADHPITRGFAVGQVLAPAYWEADLISEDYRVLAQVEGVDPQRGVGSAAVAVHRHRPVAYLGPMSWTDLVARHSEHAPALLDIFCRTVAFLLEQVRRSNKER